MKRILVVLTLLLASAPCFAVGTCLVSDVTSTQNVNSRVPDSETVIVTLTCTADAAAGTYPVTTIPLVGYYPANTVLNAYNLTGYILYAVGRSVGTTAPTANYTTIITDNRGFVMSQALMTGNGTATGLQFTWMSPTTAPEPVFPVVRGPLTVAISANSVNSAQITLDLIFRTRI